MKDKIIITPKTEIERIHKDFNEHFNDWFAWTHEAIMAPPPTEFLGLSNRYEKKEE